MHPLNKNPNFRSYKKATNMQKLYKLTIVILMCSVNLLCIHPLTKNGGHGDPMEDDARHRLDYEFRRLAGPDGTIPQHMREKELALQQHYQPIILFNKIMLIHACNHKQFGMLVVHGM